MTIWDRAFRRLLPVVICCYVLAFGFVALASTERYAPKEHEHDDTQAQQQDQRQGQGQKQGQGQAQDQTQTALSDQTQSQGQEAIATNEGVTSSADVTVQGDTFPRQVPNQYFNYSPNFIQCNRTIGLQIANTSGAASLGIPIGRQKDCDLWLAVEEAQQNGHVLLSYAFMCEIKNVKKVWGLDRCQQVTGLAEDWWNAAVGKPSNPTRGSGTAEEEPNTTAKPETLFAQTEVEQYHDDLDHDLEEAKLENVRQEAEISELKRRLREQRRDQSKQEDYVSERVALGSTRRATARAHLELLKERLDEEKEK